MLLIAIFPVVLIFYQIHDHMGKIASPDGTFRASATGGGGPKISDSGQSGAAMVERARRAAIIR